MARVFESIADAQAGIQGYKSRNAFAAAQREARLARLNSPEALARKAHLRQATEDHRLVNVVSTAEDHVGLLRGKLDAARRQAQYMAENAYLTGDIHADAAKVSRQIEGLPDLIARAEQALADARQALADHRASTADANVAEPVPSPVEVKPPHAPAAEASRGRGRPPKVTK